MTVMSQRTVAIQLRLPRAIHAALRAEALRRLGEFGRRPHECTPSGVAADALTKFLPDYIAAELRRDFAPPVEVEVEMKAIEKKPAADAVA